MSLFHCARNLLLNTTKRPPFPGWDQVDELGRVRLELGSDINRYLIIHNIAVKSGNKQQKRKSFFEIFPGIDLTMIFPALFFNGSSALKKL